MAVPPAHQRPREVIDLTLEDDQGVSSVAPLRTAFSSNINGAGTSGQYDGATTTNAGNDAPPSKRVKLVHPDTRTFSLFAEPVQRFARRAIGEFVQRTRGSNMLELEEKVRVRKAPSSNVDNF